MTHREANVEAQRRYGQYAFALQSGRSGNYLVFSRGLYLEGVGPTWDAAFADADRKSQNS